MAGGLRALGLGPGDVVAFQLPNWVEAADHLLRLRHARRDAGARSCTSTGPRRSGFILRQSRARALIIVSRIGHARLPGRAGHHPRRPRRPGARDRGRGRRRPATRRSYGSPFDELRRRRAHRRARRRRPRRRRPSSGTRRAPRPTPRASCTPTAPSAARCASSRPTSPSATGANLVGRPGRPRHRHAGRPALPAGRRHGRST